MLKSSCDKVVEEETQSVDEVLMNADKRVNIHVVESERARKTYLA
jgi:hypothetical protein